MTTIPLTDAIKDGLTLTDEGADATWPNVSAELNIRWSPPEPDVGIFFAIPDIIGTTWFIDGEAFTDDDTFFAELHDRLGDFYEEGEDGIRRVTDQAINDAELEEGA